MFGLILSPFGHLFMPVSNSEYLGEVHYEKENGYESESAFR